MCKVFCKKKFIFVMVCLLLSVNFFGKIFSQENIFDLVDNGCVEKIKLLIKKNSKIIGLKNNSVLNRGETLLNHACRKNNLGVIRAVVESLPKDSVEKFINEVGLDGETPLSCACYKNNLDMVKYLIKKGAVKSINFVNIYAQSPLYWACFNNNIDMVRYLMNNGAVIDEYCLEVAEDMPKILEFLKIMADEVGISRGKKSSDKNLKIK